MAKPRIIVAGGGYAGLAAVKAFQNRDDVEVILIDPSPVHQLVPELPTVFRPNGSVRDHTVRFATLLEDDGVEHRQEAVATVEAAEKTVILQSGHRLSFDWLLVSIGSVTKWPPIEGLREHAFPFRTAKDAGRLHERLQGQKGLKVVVLGGGLTGVEVAGELAPEHHVHIVEMAPRILPEVGPGLSGYGTRVLKNNGIQISTSTKVKGVEKGRLLVEDADPISFDVLVWTGGIAAPDIKWAGVELDERGYPKADDWGEIAPSVFVAGDVYIVRRNGQVVPQTAQLAMETGRFVARTILSRITEDQKGPPFKPRFKGLLVALDEKRGVGWVMSEGLAVKGYSARALKGLVFSQYRFKLAAAFPAAPLRD